LFALALAMSIAGARGSGNFSRTGNMNAARLYHTATLLDNGEVLVAGGIYGLAAKQTAEVYDPARGKFTLTGNLNTGRWQHQAVLLPDGRVLVAGGFDTNDNFSATAEIYNPSTGTWSPTGSMSTGRVDFVPTVLPNGLVLAAGGNGYNVTFSSAELYNPATGTWTQTGAMTAGYSGWGAVLLQDGQVLAIVSGGVDLYNPASGTWTTTTPSPSGAGFAGLLPNGLAFFGGDEFYDPSTAQWTTFAAPSSFGGFAVLTTGQVLAAGSVFYVNARPYPIEETSKASELWNPSTLAWTSTGNLNVSRIHQTMTLLLNGQVLAAGGESFDKNAGALVPIASAELYTQ
jgi:hypothetical protein